MQAGNQKVQVQAFYLSKEGDNDGWEVPMMMYQDILHKDSSWNLRNSVKTLNVLEFVTQV